ncbi:hypothetical protein Pelo_8252 [Pelomyxa schiedti]|nr:hypothetical protein Pelo_8252 [Pelomyxa schiedti]
MGGSPQNKVIWLVLATVVSVTFTWICLNRNSNQTISCSKQRWSHEIVQGNRNRRVESDEFNPSIAVWPPSLLGSRIWLMFYRVAQWDTGTSLIAAKRYSIDEFVTPPFFMDGSESTTIITTPYEPNWSACGNRGLGFEDPRPLILPGATAVMIMANALTEKCLRRMVTITVDFETLSVSDITFLHPPVNVSGPQVEKNWVAFLPPGAARPVFAQSIEPHTIVSCEHGGMCEVVSQSTWLTLPILLGYPDAHLRGSSVAVERGEDFLALGHITTPSQYIYFLYTFEKTHPFRITGASGTFLLSNQTGKRQYASGLTQLSTHWYSITYSTEDSNLEVLDLPACVVHKMVTQIQPLFVLVQPKTKF